MKNKLILLIIVSLFGCSSEPTLGLSGTWDNTSQTNYLTDTLSIEYDIDLNREIITIKSDSGIMDVSLINDSIVDIRPTTKRSIIQFHFDDKEQGVLSFYELDKEEISSNEDPRVTAENYNFSTFSENEKTFLIIDQHFSQYGRALDTIEYQLILKDKLILAKDTLTRIKL
ncbi:MAG: hypothetical protein R3321_10405 [Nitrososphaeraceae archaeon]|nr:hypothetical protein [Nitrososphaeraceae archaeon]